MPLEHEYPLAPINFAKLPDDYPLNGADALLLHLLRQAHDIAVTINVVSKTRTTLRTMDTEQNGLEDETYLRVISDDGTIERATLVCPSTTWMYVRDDPQDGDRGNESKSAELECVALGLLIRSVQQGSLTSGR